MPRLSHAALTADMNVTPMLDVLLVLLVVFMAATEVLRTMDVRLPDQCAASCTADGSALVLEVLPGPAYRLNSQPIATPELLARLRAVYAGRPNKVLQVAGDRRARYQDVLSAMDVARSAGVKVIGLPPSDLALSH